MVRHGLATAYDVLPGPNGLHAVRWQVMSRCLTHVCNSQASPATRLSRSSPSSVWGSVQNGPMPRSSQWFEFASATPFAATEWLGLGPFSQPSRTSESRLRKLAPTSNTLWTALDSIGATGARLVSVLLWCGGEISGDRLAVETPSADPGDLEESIERLVGAGMVVRSASGGLVLRDDVRSSLAPIAVSMADQNAITSEQLAQVCIVHSIVRAPTRKQERIDLLAARFADPEGRARLRGSLSDRARRLLSQIADVAGPRVVDVASVGLPSSEYTLSRADTPRYAFGRDRQNAPDEVAPLAELTAHGIVGLDPWERKVWIWREAWPLLDRPLFTDWAPPPVPTVAAAAVDGLRLPPLVGLVDRALQHWEQVPPAVLKNGEPRLAKPAVRSTAKALGTDEATVDIVAGAALSLGLLLANVAQVSGRGRNRKVDRMWLPDPTMVAAWSAAPASARWLRLVAEWANPADPTGMHQLVANRHLVLWELGRLTRGQGWVADEVAAAWIEHRHGWMSVAEAVLECLRDLRALGVVTASGPTALTELGRLALDDPKAVLGADLGGATTAVVQADESVVCPPDLDPDVLVRLGRIARLESDAGARIFRLDDTLVTKAVQRGDTSEQILEFLAELSSVPLPDTVRRLVTDAAAQADRVRIVEASSVVVVSDPVDLVTACKLKSAKLMPVSETVAVSTLPAAKLREILDRKGLAPTVASTGEGSVSPRTAADDAAELEQRARQQREFAERHHHTGLAASARRLEDQAREARDLPSKFAVRGPIAVTPALLERLRR